MKTIEQVLIEIAAVCESLDIAYAVMGGLAVRIHGIPRPTFDVDLTIVADENALNHFFAAVEGRGYTVPDQYRKGWLDRVAEMPIVKIRTWLSDGLGIDVDLFVSESQFQDSLIKRRKSCDFEGKDIWVVTPEDLVLLKLLANRHRDRGDVVDILFVQGQLDEGYLRTWADQLGIGDRLAEALTERDEH